MNKVLGPIAALSILFASSLAFGEESSGRIQTINAEEQEVTLDNGMKFGLDDGVSIDALKPGDEVKVTYEDRDGEKVATEISKPEE